MIRAQSRRSCGPGSHVLARRRLPTSAMLSGLLTLAALALIVALLGAAPRAGADATPAFAAAGVPTATPTPTGLPAPPPQSTPVPGGIGAERNSLVLGIEVPSDGEGAHGSRFSHRGLCLRYQRQAEPGCPGQRHRAGGSLDGHSTRAPNPDG